MEKKVIELNKAKVKLLVFASWSSFAALLWMFSPAQIGVVIWTASLVFFGACGIFGMKKLLDRKPGLIFTSVGLYDNASLVPAGNIPWSEITGVEVLKLKKQALLVVKLVRPQKYIEDRSPLKSKLRTTTFETYGSPIAIPSNDLQIDFKDLLGIFNDFLLEHGKGT
jgi:hypothetical protein